jgi:hypothetical protein
LETQYPSYIEEDEVLRRLVGPALPVLANLNSERIETLVFYLKSLHNYYPEGENHVTFHQRFSDKLDAIRNGAEQKALQKDAARRLFRAMCCCVAVGFLLTVGVVLALGGAWGYGVAAGFGAVALFLFAEAKFGRPALDAAKAQDRQYFLACLRSARACNELDWCGLFSYNGVTQPGPQSDEDEARTHARIAELTSQLRNALYNDEYLQYSGGRS